MHLTKGRRAQDGAQLGGEHGRFGQAPADGAQAERGVEVGVVALRAVQRLVRTDVNGADGHRQTAHVFHGAAVGGKLLLLAGQVPVATHEQKFAAKQAHPDRAAGQSRRHVLGHFNIGHQLDHLTIARHRRGVEQARQPRPFGQVLGLLALVFGTHGRRRIDDDQSGVAVNDDPVILAHQLAGAARADHRRNIQAAGDDGGVGGLAAHIGHKAGKRALFEVQHVCRRKVVRDQNQVIVGSFSIGFARFAATGRAARQDGAGDSLHSAQHPLHNLFEVGFAFPQIRIFHLVKSARQHFELRRQSPFGVVKALAHPLFDALPQHLVVEQHQVHIEQGAQLLRCVFGTHELDAGLQAADFFNHRIAAPAQAVNLDRDLLRFNEVVRNVVAARTHQHRAAHDDAARNR